MSSKSINKDQNEKKQRPSTFPENANLESKIHLATTQEISEERLQELLKLNEKLNDPVILIAMASNEHFVGSSVASFSLLKRFAIVENIKVKSALSANPECPTEILEIFVDNTTYYPIRTNVVKHDKCTFEMLKKLCKDGSSHVRMKIAERYDLPPLVSKSEYCQILEIMSLKTDETDEIKNAILSSLKIKGYFRIYENIMIHSDSEDVLSTLASTQWSEFDPDKVDEIFENFSTHEFLAVKEAVAQNVSVKGRILFSMRNDQEGNVINYLLRNTSFPFDGSIEYLTKLTETQLGNLLLNRHLPHYVQNHFILNENLDFKKLIAERQLHMLEDKLLILALDEDDDLRRQVAKRSDLDEACVKTLATDDVTMVVEALLKNEYVGKYHDLIREEMLKNQKFPRAMDLLVSILPLSPEEIDTLMNFERLDAKLLLSLITNPKQPVSSETLHKLGTDLDTHVTVRTAIAEHKNISPETVKTMLKQERKTSKLYPVLKALYQKMRKTKPAKIGLV